MDPKTSLARLSEAARHFATEEIDEQGGPDPVAALYPERRASYSLFSLQLGDAHCEALRPYLFGRAIPRRPGDPPVTCLNLIEGEWRTADELVARSSPADRRVTLFQLARSRDADCAHAVDRAFAFWSSLEWAREA